MSIRSVVLSLLCLGLPPAFGEEEFSFDFVPAEPKPYSIGGYLEFRPALSVLDSDNVLFDLNHPDGGPDTEPHYLLRAQLEGTYDWDDVHFKLRTNTDLTRSRGEWDTSGGIHEAYVTWQVDPNLALDAGRKQIKWGTGYSWSPVAFLDRPKDPDEPDLPRAGYNLVSAEYVKSFEGRLQNLAVMAAVIPRTGGINSDFGDSDHINVAGRVHLLWSDTDIDLIALSGGSQPVRYGLDFARNIKTHFEVHGEWSHTPSERRSVVERDGTVTTSVGSADRLLLGLRYLTISDVTYICEYQHNSIGMSQAELASFYDFTEAAVEEFRRTGSGDALARARRLNRELYSSRPLGRNYLYLRASVKEPHDILYFTPAVTAQVNLDDGSSSLMPEVVYTGYENWDLRARLAVLGGGGRSEFGAKQNQARFELMARHYF